MFVFVKRLHVSETSTADWKMHDAYMCNHVTCDLLLFMRTCSKFQSFETCARCLGDVLSKSYLFGFINSSRKLEFDRATVIGHTKKYHLYGEELSDLKCW